MNRRSFFSTALKAAAAISVAPSVLTSIPKSIPVESVSFTTPTYTFNPQIYMGKWTWTVATPDGMKHWERGMGDIGRKFIA